ncbi:hypothetical protein [Lentzea albidocapillata]|uniref:Uncharacterized protein n=1 Tax=Lentzea albidocapillata TaxID=40571 RepID=A0A1W2CKZ3_9PSEU|nr:hypothetical protein [Lentzea albidocapillata]SMC85572.1 hypothetical protein SAMN05660733_02127 [Lentzea albidocapillata]
MTSTARTRSRTTARRGSYLAGALAVALVVNLLCLVRPRLPFTAVGDVISTAAGLVALIRTAQVFPFAFTDPTTDWVTIVRLSLVSIIVVVSIALLVQLVVLVRILVSGGNTPD